MTQFSVVFQFAQKVNKDLFKAIKEELGKEINVVWTLKNVTHLSLLATIKDNSRFAELFDRLMTVIAMQADRFGYTTPEQCAVCNKPGVDAFAYTSTYSAVHASCVKEKRDKTAQKLQSNELNGNYFLGFLGAVLGGIVGSLPNVLLMALAGYISAYLCALIPLGAYFGYRLLRGKMNAFATVMTGIISLVMIPISNYLMYLVTFWNESQEIVYPNEYILALQLYFEDFIPELGQTALFIVLGFIFVLGIVSRGNKHSYAEVSFLGDTLRPMQGQPVAVPAGVPVNAPAPVFVEAADGQPQPTTNE